MALYIKKIRLYKFPYSLGREPDIESQALLTVLIPGMRVEVKRLYRSDQMIYGIGFVGRFLQCSSHRHKEILQTLPGDGGYTL